MTNRAFKSGESRGQASLLPPRIEDYVGPDNPVRAIESFVCALDLAKLGFSHADRGPEAMGQPPYDPADLLKLYLYGYINQVRSSRRLEREACRNLELIWLLRNLRPGYRTIGRQATGQSFFWQVTFDYRINTNLQLSFNYNGRKEGAGSPIDLARMEARELL